MAISDKARALLPYKHPFAKADDIAEAVDRGREALVRADGLLQAQGWHQGAWSEWGLPCEADCGGRSLLGALERATYSDRDMEAFYAAQGLLEAVLAEQGWDRREDGDVQDWQDVDGRTRDDVRSLIAAAFDKGR